MTPLRIGSLCSGFGGLDLSVEDVLDAELAWYAQYEPPDKNGKPDKNQYAAQIMAHRWPGVPNHGDITTIDYTSVEPVDILTAGFPCQPASAAGRRLGTADSRWLWNEVLRAIAALRPSLVLLENVSGLLTGGNDIDEPNDRCVCGWPYRRGGMHRDLQVLEGALWRPRGHRDDGQGTPDPGSDAAAVRGGDQCLPAAHRAVGRGELPVDQRQGRGSDAGADRAALAVKSRTGSDRDEGRGTQGSASGEPGRGGAVVRLAAGALRDAEAADSRVEPEGADGAFDPATGERVTDCQACGRPLGDGSVGSAFRPWMGAVQRSLAEIGFDAEWCVVRASDVGAPHRRERVFIGAWPVDRSPRVDWWASSADAHQSTRGERRLAAPRQEEVRRSWADLGGRGGTSAPDASCLRHERNRPARNWRPGPADGGIASPDTDLFVPGDDGELPGGRHALRQWIRPDALGCSSAVADAEGDGRDEGCAEPAREFGRSDAAERGGATADTEGAGLEARREGRAEGGSSPDADRHAVRQQPVPVATRDSAPESELHGIEWGAYADAVHRWEAALGRPAPRATDDRGRLAAPFVEWMMGLSEGWVTGMPGIPRNAQLKALGNGVVPQQGAAALRLLLDAAGFSLHIPATASVGAGRALLNTLNLLEGN